MKYVILIGDGMADYPIPERGGKTALQIAATPNLDFVATAGVCGLVKTIPEELAAGSDIATLSILGYDPAKYYTGRGPLEALGMRVPLEEGDLAFRCNLVTVREGKFADYSGGHPTNEEARGLIAALNEELGGSGCEFYPGVSYRNILVLKSESKNNIFAGAKEIGGAPPHDIIGARVEEELPREEVLREIVLASREIFGKAEKANLVWLWSGGRKPEMPAFSGRYGVSGGGSVISGVDLIKGIGRCVGLEAVEVPGATGYFDTNYEGKVEYALRSLKERDFVLLHVEAPDEAGHLGEIDLKVKAIEDFDALVVGKMLQGLEQEFADFKVLVLPDHYTPVSLRTHTREPVPFAIFSSPQAHAQAHAQNHFDEIFARQCSLAAGRGVLDARAGDLMRQLLKEER
mgnify:CR=1 FL=1